MFVIGSDHSVSYDGGVGGRCMVAALVYTQVAAGEVEEAEPK